MLSEVETSLGFIIKTSDNVSVNDKLSIIRLLADPLTYPTKIAFRGDPDFAQTSLIDKNRDICSKTRKKQFSERERTWTYVTVRKIAFDAVSRQIARFGKRRVGVKDKRKQLSPTSLMYIDVHDLAGLVFSRRNWRLHAVFSRVRRRLYTTDNTSLLRR